MDYDLIVIGSGPAGEKGAAQAAYFGKRVCLVERAPKPGHPLGIRGVGEVPIVPPPAAIANAIYKATGVRMVELPMSPPKLMKAILKRRAAGDSQAAAAD